MVYFQLQLNCHPILSGEFPYSLDLSTLSAGSHTFVVIVQTSGGEARQTFTFTIGKVFLAKSNLPHINHVCIHVDDICNIYYDSDPDVDECIEDMDDCVEGATCMNTDGSFTCMCAPGFTGDGRASGRGCIGVYLYFTLA